MPQSHLSGGYAVVEAELDTDHAAAVSIWRTGLAGLERGAQQKFEWFYRNNPAGPGRLFLLRDRTAQAVGVGGLGVRRWSLDSHAWMCGLCADLAVEARHRTLGPSLALIKHVARVGADAYALLYGFPNEKARPVYSRAGYQTLGAMQRYARPLRHARHLARRLGDPLAATIGKGLDLLGSARDLIIKPREAGRYRDIWPAAFDARFTHLWDTARRPYFAAARDAGFLAWRFSSNPFYPYEIYALEVNATRELAGYVVFRMETEANRVCADDFYALHPRLLPFLLTRFAMAMHALGRDSVSLEFFGASAVQQAILKAGFRPRAQRPIVIASCRDAVWASAQWFVTAADEDL